MAVLAGPNLSTCGAASAGVTVINNFNESHPTGFPVLTQGVIVTPVGGSPSRSVGYPI